jgi:Uma2 family endonuclease
VTVTHTARFTRADYLRLPEGFPAQLIDGMLVKEPPPIPWHQSLVGRILLAFSRRIDPDRVLPAPVDVFIDDFNILQPDILVLEEGHAPGPEDREVALPLLVVEVLSPSTANRDRDFKTAAYLRRGVREVWLTDPDTQTIEIRTRGRTSTLARGQVARSRAVPGLELVPDDLFRT